MKSVHLFVLFILLIGCFENKKTQYDYSFELTTEISGAKSWIFKGKYRPPLNLNNDSVFINHINRALGEIGLPNIYTRVLEKELKTGYRQDRGIYEWVDYPLGVLQITRSTENNANHNLYNCIWKITLIEGNRPLPMMPPPYK